MHVRLDNTTVYIYIIYFDTLNISGFDQVYSPDRQTSNKTDNKLQIKERQNK